MKEKFLINSMHPQQSVKSSNAITIIREIERKENLEILQGEHWKVLMNFLIDKCIFCYCVSKVFLLKLNDTQYMACVDQEP